MEIFKNIILDWILFSIIEAYIFCLFFEKVGECKKYKQKEVLVISIINCISTNLLIAIIMQLTVVLYLSFYNYKYKKNNSNMFFNIKLVFCAIGYFSIIEVLYSIFIYLVVHIDLFMYSPLKLFIHMIPLRVIEILIIYKVGDKMKIILGTGVKR